MPAARFERHEAMIAFERFMQNHQPGRTAYEGATTAALSRVFPRTGQVTGRVCPPRPLSTARPSQHGIAGAALGWSDARTR
jgi:hypothetical protein